MKGILEWKDWGIITKDQWELMQKSKKCDILLLALVVSTLLKEIDDHTEEKTIWKNTLDNNTFIREMRKQPIDFDKKYSAQFFFLEFTKDVTNTEEKTAKMNFEGLNRLFPQIENCVEWHRKTIRKGGQLRPYLKEVASKVNESCHSFIFIHGHGNEDGSIQVHKQGEQELINAIMSMAHVLRHENGESQYTLKYFWYEEAMDDLDDKPKIFQTGLEFPGTISDMEESDIRNWMHQYGIGIQNLVAVSFKKVTGDQPEKLHRVPSEYLFDPKSVKARKHVKEGVPQSISFSSIIKGMMTESKGNDLKNTINMVWGCCHSDQVHEVYHGLHDISMIDPNAPTPKPRIEHEVFPTKAQQFTCTVPYPAINDFTVHWEFSGYVFELAEKLLMERFHKYCELKHNQDCQKIT